MEQTHAYKDSEIECQDSYTYVITAKPQRGKAICTWAEG